MMSDLVILDTSIFIDDLRTACHQGRIQSLVGLIRNSSVVLSELWRGATKPKEREFLHALQKNYPLLTPTEKNWIESGQILSRIHSDHGFQSIKLRDLHFDVLIALTVRNYGARLITSNATDFELINRYKKFRLEIW